MVECTTADCDVPTRYSHSAASLYVLNAASLAKLYAVEQVAVKLNSCNIDVAVTFESYF